MKLNQEEVKRVAEAYKNVKVVSDPIAYSPFTFESSLVYDAPKKFIFEDCYIAVNDSGIRAVFPLDGFSGDMETTVARFLKTGVTKGLFIEGESPLQMPIMSEMKKSSFPYKSFIYDNREEAINFVGKDFHRFRTSKAYLDDSDIRVEEYTTDIPLTREALGEVHQLNKSWAGRYSESNNDRIWYNPDGIINNIYEYPFLDTYVSLVYCKDTLIHYHSSERICNNMIILLDSHVNFGVNDSVLTKYRYTNFLQHGLHLKHWDKLSENKEKIYYHSGGTKADSYKCQLRPSIKNNVTKYTLVESRDESNSLF